MKFYGMVIHNPGTSQLVQVTRTTRMRACVRACMRAVSRDGRLYHIVCAVTEP